MQAGGLISNRTMFHQCVRCWLDYHVSISACNFCLMKTLFEPSLVEFRAKRASTPCRYEPPSPPVVWLMKKDGLQTHQWQWFTETVRHYTFGCHLISTGLKSCDALWFIRVGLSVKSCAQISTLASFSVMTSCRCNNCGYKWEHYCCVSVRMREFGGVWCEKLIMIHKLNLYMWKPPGGLLVGNMVLFL